MLKNKLLTLDKLVYSVCKNNMAITFWITLLSPAPVASRLRTYPFIRAGTVSQELSDILTIPEEYVPPTRKLPIRVSSKARVLTASDVNDDFSKQIQFHEAKKRKNSSSGQGHEKDSKNPRLMQKKLLTIGSQGNKYTCGLRCHQWQRSTYPYKLCRGKLGWGRKQLPSVWKGLSPESKKGFRGLDVKIWTALDETVGIAFQVHLIMQVNITVHNVWYHNL